MPLTDIQGKQAVSLARTALERFVGEGKATTPTLQGHMGEKRGVFVTLSRSNGALRGCIGFPYPVKPLGTAIVEAAVMASSEDPRFPPVAKAEIPTTLVEVSVLTVPELLEAKSRTELPGAVRIGVDGLIVSNSFTSGLLLPQVATDFNFGPADFLSETCMKAGLTPDSWLDKATRVQRFQADVFSEVSPRGEVRRAIR